MRHKTHMAGPVVDHLDAVLAELGGNPLCGQKYRARPLLPPAVVGSWDAVTCERCLGHRPHAPVGWVTHTLRAFMARVRG